MDIQSSESPTNSPKDASTDRLRESLMPRVRRRNRMITSCLECRRRKLKCDKQQPCTNCQKFSRDCMFLAPALDTVTQKKLNELKEKMGTLERTLEEDVAKRKADDRKKNGRRESADLPGEGSESEEGPTPDDEIGLEATPMATVDAMYDESNGVNDDVLDLGFRVGKFRMSDRLGGLFRPKLAEELVFALKRDKRQGTEPEPPLKDDPNTFLEHGPTYIAPGSSFVFGGAGDSRSIIDFLPTKAAADLLIKRYYHNCHFLARVVHWPTFQVQYERFWASILSGIEPPPSLQCLVFAVFFSAVAAMSNAEIDSVFQQTHRRVLTNFQRATEAALGKANFLRTTKFETLQGLVIYLVPMCRGEISRAHSVLVGAAIRLGECFSLHRDPIDAFGHAPVEAQVRRLAWFQLCYLDFRTAEAQGPRPSIKRDDYDTKMPWNLDDADLVRLQPRHNQQIIELQEKEDRWTDATLSKIRFECCEMHRIVWHDRVRLDKQKVSITHCLSKIEAFRSAMDKKYAWLDTSITIQHYARILLRMLLLRMHIMILHKYHNATSTRIPDRLRQIIIGSATTITEDAVKLEIDPKFDSFRWYASALQQWHAAFLLLVEVFVYPNRKEADRIWSVLDHAFEPDLTLTRVQKARSILGAVRDRAAAFRDVRKMSEPVSMRNRLSTSLPARARISGPDMIVPAGQRFQQQGEASTDDGGTRRTSNVDHSQVFTSPNMLSSAIRSPTRDPTRLSQASGSNQQGTSNWTFDTPFTSFVGEKLPVPLNRAQSGGFAASTSPQYTGIRHQEEPSPSNSSRCTEEWPPKLLNVQQAAYQYTQNSVSSPQAALSPSEYSTSPPPTYGNSAMGLLSGEYIPTSRPNTTPAASTIGYSTGATPDNFGATSPEARYFNGPSAAANMIVTDPSVSGPNVTWKSPSNQKAQDTQDIPMLDIDWAEWDKLFPIEVNSGELDLPPEAQYHR